MSLITEFHSGFLTASCMRAVYHRHKGEVEPVATTALVRGLAAGAALEQVHREGLWGEADAGPAATFGMVSTVEKLGHEKRPMSETVQRDLDKITEEVATMTAHYIRRQGEYFSKCKLIGCEVPVRWNFAIPGRAEVAPMASHLDLLYYDPDGAVVVRDWKWHDTAAGFEYLGRQMQMALYHLIVRYGFCKVGHSNDDEFDWVNYGVAPLMEWFQLDQLKVYKRKTTVKHWDGSETEYQAGEDRPLANVCRRWMFADTKEQAMKEEIAKRIIMADHNLFPINPDKVGCTLCESRKWCPCFHRDEDAYRP